MKKGLLIMALILAIVLTLTPFPGNKAEAYYGGYIGFGYDNGEISGFSRFYNKEGYIFVQAREEEPNPLVTITEKEPSSPVLGPGSGGLPSKPNHPENKLRLGSLIIFPDIMPPMGAGPIPYPPFPMDPEWLWSGFPAMPSSSPMLQWTPAFPPNPYWLDFYPMVPYLTPPGNIQIPW